MSRGRSARSNLAETCHAMLVSTVGMSKSRHQQLLQSLPVNFCGPRVYPHKLVDHWFQPHCDFDWFSTSTCDMASVSRGNLSSTRLPRPMSTQGRGWIPGARHYPLVMMSISVGILLVILLEFSLILTFPSISPGISMDFRRFPGARASQRLAMLSFRTGRKSNKGHCSLNSTETVRLKCCEFTNLYEL